MLGAGLATLVGLFFRRMWRADILFVLIVASIMFFFLYWVNAFVVLNLTALLLALYFSYHPRNLVLISIVAEGFRRMADPPWSCFQVLVPVLHWHPIHFVHKQPKTQPDCHFCSRRGARLGFQACRRFLRFYAVK